MTSNRTWIGPDFWANRLQDWQLNNGRMETTETAAGRPMRTLHLLTKRTTSNSGNITMEVEAGWLDTEAPSDSAEIGFLIGAGGMLDYRAAALIHHSAGPGAGLYVGMDRSGNLFMKDLNQSDATIASMPGNTPLQEITHLRLTVSPDSDGYYIALTRVTPGSPESEQTLSLGGQSNALVEGNLALVASYDRAWFKDWSVSGSKIESYPNRHAGPVLGTQYTLHEQVLKITAQLMPVGETDNQDVRLEINTNGQWIEAASAQVINPGYTAPFRVEGWDDSQDIPYRVAYDLKLDESTTRTYYWEGTIRKDPIDKEIVSVAGFTGNHNTGRGVEGGNFRWVDRVWFPHSDIINHLGKQDVDVLFFSGDQVYEGASPTFPDRANAHLDYLYKWYLWSWAFRDVTKDRPTITIPDDHDVYQGNIWGAGGPPTDKDDKGGYVMPAEWVKMIERTQTSHLPDPYDPTPIQQGIGVYYTNMNYGRIGIAIIEDRKFKSGCNGLVPGKEGRPDHFPNPDFDPSIVDLPGLTLLGDRQLDFLNDWASNWRGHDMKLVVSQTVFANMATHHGPNLMRLYGDLDSNGWPKKGRDKAIDALRRGYAFMLQGDQHLSTIVHHGVDTPNDAGYSFCVPSIANFYPRGWMPEAEGANRPEGAASNFGEHQDAFGNYVTVYAHTNPTALTGVSTGVAPLALHDKMPGYGIARFNKTDRTITMENWPRYADPSDPSTGTQYKGWPKTIAMEDNYGRQAMGYLPEINVSGITNPVVQVIHEASQEIIYTLRINGSSFTPKVFTAGSYTVRVGDQDADNMQELTGLMPGSEDTLEVFFLEAKKAVRITPDRGVKSESGSGVYLRYVKYKKEAGIRKDPIPYINTVNLEYKYESYVSSPTETVSFTALDEVPLVGTLFKPSEVPHTALLINSGTGIPRRFYFRFARYAAKLGFAVFTYDYRGIGDSAPESLRGYEARYRDWGQRDVPAAIAWLHNRYAGIPIAVVGHSTGGQQLGLAKNVGHIKAALFVAVSTGYWRDMIPTYKWVTLALWTIYLPLATRYFGYAPAKKVKWGENLPSGVAREWGTWCRQPDYMAAYFDEGGRYQSKDGEPFGPVYFSEAILPIRAYCFTDDPIATRANVKPMLSLYTKADIETRWLEPHNLSVPRVGHLGFFRSDIGTPLWDEALAWLKNKSH